MAYLARKSRYSQTESFVIVKPPPTIAASQLLYLQIQFVTPSPYGPSSPSSEHSESSISTSSTSNLQKVATAAAPINRRRIIPLLNVYTPNHSSINPAVTVHDAGTDEPVATFSRFGVKFENVAFFETIEINGHWPENHEDTNNVQNAHSQIGHHCGSPARRSDLASTFFNRFFQAKSPPLSTSPSISAQKPVFGVTPRIRSSPFHPPQGSPPTSYVWSVRHWQKGLENITWPGSSSPSTDSQCEFRLSFEWSKGKSSQRGNKSSFSPSPNQSVLEFRPVPPRSLTPQPYTTSKPLLATPDAGRRPRRSSSHRWSEDNDSDQEDHEVSWLCTVIVAPKMTNVNADSSPQDLDNEPVFPLRIKVASLASAPNHPRVLARLKILAPLPDIDLARADTLKRTAAPGIPGSRPRDTFVLTAEEIKDIICTTALWIGAREGFGGIGKR